MNALIALMGDAQSEIMEQKISQTQRLKTKMMVEQLQLLPEKYTNNIYCQTVHLRRLRATSNEEEDLITEEAWEGTTKAIKKHMDMLKNDIMDDVKKEMGEVKKEIGDVKTFHRMVKIHSK